MHDAFRVVDEIGVVGQGGFRVRLYHGHQPLVLRHFLLAEVLLQDNQVTAHLRARVVREQVVGQAYRGYQIGLTEQLVTHGGLGAIQYPLRGDERHDTAVTHGIQSFEKEIVVDGFLGGASAERVAPLKLRVEHGNVTERNVGHRQVEIIVERSFDFLKTAGAHFLVGIEMPQDCTREQILLESHHIRIGAVPQHGIHEHADTCRRFEHTGGADAVICQHVRDGVGYLFGGVESGQHGRFQRIHKPLVLCFVLAVLTDKPVQLHRRGEQFEVGFRPPDGIRQFLCRVEDTFQTAETAVPLKYGTLFGCRCPIFPVKDECRPYRLDVVPQFLFAVKRHIRLSKGRLLPSAPCRAGRNRKTGRNCHPRGHRRRTRSDKRQQFQDKGFTLLFRHFIGKLVFHDFAEDGVTGIMQPAQQRVHRQFLRTIGGIAFKPCPLIRFGGTVGPFPYESGVVSLFKLVRAEIVQQVQTVIGKVGLTLVFLLVVHYFGFSGLIINGIIGWKKEEKGTRYPSECHH